MTLYRFDGFWLLCVYIYIYIFIYIYVAHGPLIWSSIKYMVLDIWLNMKCAGGLEPDFLSPCAVGRFIIPTDENRLFSEG